MKTETSLPAVTLFPRAVALAVADLKERLRFEYERTYPELDEVIRLVIAEEEAHAWDLSAFPHLFLPDLVELHLTRLGLEPVETRRENTFPAMVGEPLLAVAC